MSECRCTALCSSWRRACLQPRGASRFSSVNDCVLSEEPGTENIEQLGKREHEFIIQYEQRRVQFPLPVLDPFEQESKEKSQRILIERVLDIKARLVKRFLEGHPGCAPARFEE